MVKTYVRPSQMFVRGVGSVLYDMENRKYIDFTAGIAVNSLGHGDEHLCNLIFDQVCSVRLVSMFRSLLRLLWGVNLWANDSRRGKSFILRICTITLGLES